ncbi:hypothetical protein GEMRC1_008335 [Eukaryota sp. GEM-RC1]
MSFQTILSNALASVASGESRCVLCTPLKIVGSVPTPNNSCMVVSFSPSKGFNNYGTIGGGSMELQATQIAHQILSITDSSPTILRFHYDCLNASEAQPICGGNVSILIEEIPPKSAEQWLSVTPSYYEVLSFTNNLSEILSHPSTSTFPISLSRTFLTPGDSSQHLSSDDVISLFSSPSSLSSLSSTLLDSNVLLIPHFPEPTICVFGEDIVVRPFLVWLPLRDLK